MNNDCIKALRSILEQKNISNEYKRAFFCILGSKKHVSELEISDIFGEERPISEILTQSEHETDKIKDYRIKSIEFLNFRCFCSSSVTEGKYFGLKFSRENNPCSLFLVGGNGTGKSSVFSALEWYYTGKSSLAEAAHVSVEKEQNYLTYGFGNLNTTNVGFRIATGTNEEVKEVYINQKNDIITSASFCSDLDMQQIEKSGVDLYDYVLEQLGYGDLVSLRERLNTLRANLQEVYVFGKNEFTSIEWDEIIDAFLKIRSDENLEKLEKLSSKEAIEQSITSDEHHKEFEKRWDVLKKAYSLPVADVIFQTNQEKPNLDESISKLARLYSELFFWCKERQEKNLPDVTVLGEMYDKKHIVFDKELKNEKILFSPENRKDILITISSLIKEKCDNIIQSVFDSKEKSENFIEEVMQRFSPSNEKCVFRFDKNGSLSLKIEVTTPNGSFNTSPQEYLNTFRFKLFCLALKLAVAFGKMKERNIMAPIVIDDVLDASDFENTIKLEQFVYTVYKTYDEVVAKPQHFDKPLQLILLTHDDMVQAAFKQGVMLRIIECEKTQKPLYYNSDVFICGRLFDKDDCAKYTDNDAEFINLYL